MAMSGKPIHQRVLLKLSGEALRGDSTLGIDASILSRIAEDIQVISKLGVQVGIVVGGGNLFRGEALSKAGLDRITGDSMGMLATMMNALAMRDAFERNGLSTRVLSAISMTGVVDPFDRRKAIHHLQAGRVVIFSGGTGNPLVTTDSAASLRAIEVGADILLKATNVDGIYTADPRKDPSATRYRVVSFHEALDKELGVMDLTAFCQCRDHALPIRVFDLAKPEALYRVVCGEDEGTLVQ